MKIKQERKLTIAVFFLGAALGVVGTVANYRWQSPSHEGIPSMIEMREALIADADNALSHDWLITGDQRKRIQASKNLVLKRDEFVNDIIVEYMKLP